MENKETYQSYSGEGVKRRNYDTSVDESSDLNDSDCNENYYENLDEKDDPQSNSHNMYQDLSCEQDSSDKSNSRNIQSRHINDMTSNSNDEQEESEMNGVGYDDSYQCNKRRKISETNKNNDNSTTEVKIYNTEEQKSWHGKGIAERIMQIMGYKHGDGLGKHRQGRLKPVEAAKQHGRRGFGHHVPGLEASGHKWDSGEEEVKAIETIEWIKNHHNDLPTSSELKSWLKKGPKKLVIDDETNFCNEDIVTNIINSKAVFDKLDNVEMRHARTRCNPYETIRGAFFLNRAAVKMANMDRACDFMFTTPSDLQDDELLYFADVCAGPGGFSEYVLWRKRWRAKGFGFTLKNENDFKLADFYAGSCETFHPYYGPKENGDVFDPDNQEALRKLIMTHTNNKGVHFMMSDGAFSVKGQENLQEILSKQLYLCQCLVALMIVRVGGHFVTKLFDIFTTFSAGLVYIMYRCFDEVCLFKPNSSRPANSERYLICKRKRPNTEPIVQYFKDINRILLENDDNNDVLELVSLEELEEEKRFVEYLRESNNYLGNKQIISLQKIAAFCNNSSLVESRQTDMRKECLKYWNIPDLSRKVPKHAQPHKLNNLLGDCSKFLSKNAIILTKENLRKSVLEQPLDYYCVPCGTTWENSGEDEKRNATLYRSFGRSNVYRYIRSSWVEVDDIKIELPPDTLLYGEVVFEMIKESKNQRKILALHIIDVYFLGGEDVSKKHLLERHKLAKKFCEALWKPNGSNYDRIRTKDLFPLCPDIGEKLCLKQRIMKNSRQALAYEFSTTHLDCDNSLDKPFFIPNSVLFLKSTAYPWCLNVSKTCSQKYVYNIKTKESKYLSEKPDVPHAYFSETYSNRIIWYWHKDKNMTMKDLVDHVSSKFHK
ncbi:cap methyltransferase 1 isoform X2 [Nomia melanderi]|nr:cap-specific mRNA (nucleoside-2'-O-)-methyltransferase 1 isoform X2 [Nomia melanderi]